jgi:uncharacterized membrane protein YeaQ/YmgE (transglycosylase-associated protein family)
MGGGEAPPPNCPRNKKRAQDSLAVKDRLLRLGEKEKNMLSLLYWIIGGAAAGWLMGKIMSSEGRDYVMDIVMGVAGAIGGGFLFSTMHFLAQSKMVYTALAAILGAVVLSTLARYMGGRREFGATD